MPYREHAEGLEAEVLQVLREELRGVDTAAAITAACPSKPSKRSVNRALENLEKQRQPLVKLVGKGRASKWQLVEAEQLEAFEE
jgi:membrane carboxypeptidase/penicillin-binding protein PbpC